jgi:hypothetical protein
MRSVPMADDRPGNPSGNNGSGPEGQGSQRSGRGRHRGFRGKHGGRGEDRSAGPEGSVRESPNANPLPRLEEEREMPTCPLCGKPVYDLSTALGASREQPEPAHFDCVIERVAASENLAAGEKLVYLGSGSFGVVQFKDKSESVFTVLRRVQWEKEGEKKDWRKGLSSRITNI